MSKTSTMNVQGVAINMATERDDDYICLTDMAKSKDDDSRAADVIKNWLRSRTTIEYLGAWETIYNPDFKVVEFDHFKSSAGLPTFVLSVSQWIQATNAIGLKAKAGKNGGTYAHKDIAFEFAAAISPIFKIYLIKEFQRLKEAESNVHNIEWNVKRVMSKANYYIHTAAVKEFRVPNETAIPPDKIGIVYADEAEILNYAVFGYTAKQWKVENQELVLKGHNLRDFASINQLLVLSNMESMNAVMLASGLSKPDRIRELRSIAQTQLRSINKLDIEKSYGKGKDGNFKAPDQIAGANQIKNHEDQLSDHNQKLKQALNFNPKDNDNK